MGGFFFRLFMKVCNWFRDFFVFFKSFFFFVKCFLIIKGLSFLVDEIFKLIVLFEGGIFCWKLMWFVLEDRFEGFVICGRGEVIYWFVIEVFWYWELFGVILDCECRVVGLVEFLFVVYRSFVEVIWVDMDFVWIEFGVLFIGNMGFDRCLVDIWVFGDGKVIIIFDLGGIMKFIIGVIEFNVDLGCMGIYLR